MISHCSFGFHFSYDYWWQVSFYMLIGHLYFQLRNAFSSPLPIFKLAYLFFVTELSSLYVLDIYPFTDTWVTNISSHSVGYFFSYFLCCTDFSSLIQSCLSVFAFFYLCFWCQSQEIIAISWSFSSMLFSRSSIVSCLTFRSLIHLEWNFEYDIRCVHSCMWLSSLPSTICGRDYPFPIM